MKDKFISVQSGRILTHFGDLGKPGFTKKEAATLFPDSSNSAIKELLSDMVRRGLLMRLKEGVYHIIPYEQAPDNYMPDWHLAAEYVTGGVPYYIGYYSALQIHNLIVQPSLKEQVVVSRQQRPSEIMVRDVKFQFIYHNPKHFFGSRKTWIDSFHKVPCSDLEKTIVDCLFKPNYSGGIVEIARAMYMAKANIKFDQLLSYVIKFDSQAVVKRLGYLLELLDIGNNILWQLQKLKTESYVVLDTELPKTGRYISRWGVQENIERATIQSAIYS